MRHPAREALPDVDAVVAEHPIDLLDRVLGHQTACLRQRLADHRDGERRAGHDAQRGRGQRVDALGVEVVAVQAVNERADVHLRSPKLPTFNDTDECLTRSVVVERPCIWQDRKLTKMISHKMGVFGVSSGRTN